MENTFSRRGLMTTVLLTVALTAACRDGPPRLTQPPPSPTPAQPPPPSAAPSISSITPDTGSTGGGASMQIVGSGFQTGVVVLFDDVRVTPRFILRSASETIFLETPPHSAGTIDIVVTNPDGQSGRHVGGHTYVPAETFDPNGAWVGEALDGTHRGIGFEIQNGNVMRATCYGPEGPTIQLTISEPVRLVAGAFSIFGSASNAVLADAVEIMSGRIVSTKQMVGTMNFGLCNQMSWRAFPRTTPSAER